MTLTELEENLKKLKIKDTYLNLFREYWGTPEKPRVTGWDVKKNEDRGVWEVYAVDYACKTLEGIFYTENDLCEYVFCCFKRMTDWHRFF